MHHIYSAENFSHLKAPLPRSSEFWGRGAGKEKGLVTLLLPIVRKRSINILFYFPLWYILIISYWLLYHMPYWEVAHTSNSIASAVVQSFPFSHLDLFVHSLSLLYSYWKLVWLCFVPWADQSDIWVKLSIPFWTLSIGVLLQHHSCASLVPTSQQYSQL